MCGDAYRCVRPSVCTLTSVCVCVCECVCVCVCAYVHTCVFPIACVLMLFKLACISVQSEWIWRERKREREFVMYMHACVRVQKCQKFSSIKTCFNCFSPIFHKNYHFLRRKVLSTHITCTLHTQLLHNHISYVHGMQWSGYSACQLVHLLPLIGPSIAELLLVTSANEKQLPNYYLSLK